AVDRHRAERRLADGRVVDADLRVAHARLHADDPERPPERTDLGLDRLLARGRNLRAAFVEIVAVRAHGTRGVADARAQLADVVEDAERRRLRVRRAERPER